MKKPILVVSLFLLLCFAFGCQNKAEKAELEKFRTQAKVEEQNKEIVRKTVEEWNKGNYEFLKEIETPDYAYYSPSGNPKPMSREETIEMIRGAREAFPDIIWTSEQLMATGDMVISRNVFRGTHTNTYQGIPPTGIKVELCSINILRIRDGKIVEEREDTDMLGFMQQLGMELKPKEAEKK
jgi:steroid delta-isomerase-like uncharacterized protein